MTIMKQLYERHERTDPDCRMNVVESANVVADIPAGTEITKSGIAATLIDFGKKIDDQEMIIESHNETIKRLNDIVDELGKRLATRGQKIESLESDLLLCQGANAANNRLIAKQYKTLKSFWNDRNELRDILNEAGVIVHDFRVGYGASRMFVDAVLIRNLKGDVVELNDVISKQKIDIADHRYIVANYKGHNADLKEKTKYLEAAISVCKQDSEVLTNVIEAIQVSDSEPYLLTVNKIKHIVEDYLDVPDKENTDEPNE